MRDDLLDFGGYPEIYADGVGAVDILGVNARTKMFTWQKIDGVYPRVTVLSVVRPVGSFAADIETFRASTENLAAHAPHTIVALQ
jgi:hypothetical protein